MSQLTQKSQPARDPKDRSGKVISTIFCSIDVHNN